MTERGNATLPEPWLRGTNDQSPVVVRAVVHALELAREDVDRWCGGLSEEQIHARPSGLEPVAFHVRHIARSVDRLLTYAEGRSLSADQFAALGSEMSGVGDVAGLVAEFHESLQDARTRLGLIVGENMEEPRAVGQKRIEVKLGGLLIHIAEHTQRHVGQAITTAKLVAARRGSGSRQ